MDKLFKSLILIAFCFFSTSSLCQNPFDNSSFNETRPTYVSPPINEISSARKTISATIVRNKNDYFAFLEKEFTAMGDNENSAQFKSRDKALDNFMVKLFKYTENDNWAYMGNDLAKAKSEYYEDLIKYHKSSSKLQGDINKIMRIKKEWNEQKIPLRAEPSGKSSVVTYIKNDWNLKVIGSISNFYEVNIKIDDLEIHGYVSSDYVESYYQK